MQVCFIGDSIVLGVGDEEALGWVGRVTRKALHLGVQLTAYNLGVRRDTSADIAARWKREAHARLPTEHAHRLCFSFGTNDCADDGCGLPRIEASQTVHNTEAILTDAAGRAPTLMIGPLPILDDAKADVRIENVDGMLSSVCDRLSVPYLPLFATMQNCAAWREGAARGDGTHSDAQGYTALAEHLLSWEPPQRWLNIRA